jgi:cap2 methyltransferase
MAHEFFSKYKRILLISDIRTADPSIHNEKEVDERVQRDMTMQMHWHMIMKPLRSMLKFRLPWQEGKTIYLAGDIYLPVWGPITTTESRLITHENSLETVAYDNRKYEEQMFYFNTVARPNMYRHKFHGCGIDHCYDCTAEGDILCHYLIKKEGLTFEEACRQFPRFSEAISTEISYNRTLETGNVDPADRRAKIRKRQWKGNKPAYEK